MPRLPIRACLGAALLALAACSVQAAPTLSLMPTAPTVRIGETVGLDIVVSGLSGVAPQGVLSAFDLTLYFEATTLAFTDVLFGPGLGDVDRGEALIGVTDGPTPFLIRLFAVSLLEASAVDCVFCAGPYLDELQGPSFVLARLVFTAFPGDSGILDPSFVLPADGVTLADAQGNPVSAAGDAFASVTIVPEPWTLPLVLAAAVAAARRRRLARAELHR